MSTAENIILGSLRKIRVHTDINPVSEASKAECLDIFASMVSEMEDAEYELGFSPPTALTEELYEPMSIKDHIKNLLAYRVANLFGVEPNAQLMGSIRKSEDYIFRNYRPLLLKNKPLSSTLPMGSGNKYQTFAGRGRRLADGSAESSYQTVVTESVLFEGASAEFRFTAQDGLPYFTWQEIASGGNDIAVSAGQTDIVLARGYRYEYTLALDGAATATWASVELEEGMAGVYESLTGGNYMYVGQDAMYPVSTQRSGFFDVANGNNQLRFRQQSNGGGTIAVSGTLTVKVVARI